MKKNLLILLAAVAIAALLAGCGGLKESDVPYADEMVENMLTGLNQNDYAMFSRDFGDTVKAQIDEAAFAAMAESFASTIGTYESKSFSQAGNATENGVDYTVVVYKAKFTDEDADVLVTVTFGGEEDSKTIEGLFFTSPKLRGE